MSVINRMLRDLDKRQQSERRTTSTPAAAAPKPFPWGWVLGAVVITAIAVTTVMVAWQTLFAESEDGDQVVSMPEPIREPVVEKVVAQTVEPAPELATPAAQATQPQQRMQPSPVLAEPNTTTESVPESEPEPESKPRPEPEPEPESVQAPQSQKAQGSMQVERVELSAAELAEVKFKQAREALQKGERQRAGSLFEQVIALAPEHVEARSELAAYWYGRGQIAAALAVLEQGLALQPGQSRWQLLHAKILLEGGAYQQVLNALESIDAASFEATGLYQLRATAANEVGRYALAASDYSALAQRTKEGRWWLAAAVAHEDAQQFAAAASAYERALATQQLNADARNYAQQRLQVLGEM